MDLAVNARALKAQRVAVPFAFDLVFLGKLVGRLLHEGWKLKKTLSQKISNTNIDDIYEVGLRAGALGGKLLGAGGGGFMLFYVPPDRRQALRESLRKLLCIPIAFSNRGSHVVVYEPEAPFDKALAAERCEVYAQPS